MTIKKKTLLKLLMIGIIVSSVGLILVGCNETAVSTPSPVPPTAFSTVPSMQPTQLPDLEIDSYRVTYDDCPWSDPGTIAVNINNFGMGDAGPFEVTINNETTHLDGLESLAKMEAAISFESGPVGGINAEVDSAHQVQEVDETNNTYMIIFTPPPPCITLTPTATGTLATPTNTPARPTMTPTP